jgi:hypothetical protein
VILLGIGTGIDTGNVVDLANLDLVDIDTSRVSASTLTLTPTPNPKCLLVYFIALLPSGKFNGNFK